MIQQTSLQAYREIQPELSKRQEQVYKTIMNNPGLNNTEIARKLGKPINTITPRVNELRKKELVKLKEKKQCPITKKTTMAWEIN